MSNDPKKSEVTPAPTAQAQQMQDMARAIMGEMLPAVLALQSQQGATQMAPRGPTAAVALATCQDCGQRIAGCEGKHVKMIVYPTRYPQYAEYFQGAFINGVRYLSNNANHQVLVPANAAGNIEYIIRIAEEEEVTARTQRTKSHNSGSLESPKPFNPAVEGFR